MSNTPADKRNVETDALRTLGTIIDEDGKRDAIHIGVENAIAGDVLSPGQHVTIDKVTDVASPAPDGKGVGIVDPFLLNTVKVGEHFWLLVYPGQITSLRHVWEHPDFAPSGEVIVLDEAPKPDKEAAKAWLQNFVATNLYIASTGPEFDEFIDKATNLDDDYLHMSGSDAHGDIPLEFWDHLEDYVGHPVRHKASYFSCSC